MHGGASVTLGADEAQGRVFFSAPKGSGWGSRGEEGLAAGTGRPQGWVLLGQTETNPSNGAHNIYYVKYINYEYGAELTLLVKATDREFYGITAGDVPGSVRSDKIMPKSASLVADFGQEGDGSISRRLLEDRQIASEGSKSFHERNLLVVESVGIHAPIRGIGNRIGFDRVLGSAV